MPSPTLSRDAPAAALIDCLRVLCRTTSVGWVRTGGSVTTVFTGAPVPTLNGVWASGPETTAEQLDAGLRDVAAAGVPYCIQVRPDAREVAQEVAARHGLVAAADVPLMVAVGPASVREPRELAIRRLEATESALHAALAAEAFGTPRELFEAIITEATLRQHAVRGYVGEVGGIGGVPVTTAIAATLGNAVGIFNVATAPEHRRRGYGAAITARAVSDGRAAGATWSWLQAAEPARGTYERLGFAIVEEWPCWLHL